MREDTPVFYENDDESSSQELTTRLDTDEVKNIIREVKEDSSQVFKNKESEKKMIASRIQEASSYTNHLANVISGINHEVSPWIGGALNMLSRLVMNSKGTVEDKVDPEVYENAKSKIHGAIHSLEQAVEILSTLSSNVKQLKEHSIYMASLKGTLESWVKVTLLDRYIKEMIQEDNLNIYSETLDFEAWHSPMYLAQIIFNLAKNSIDHNQHMLPELEIKIYGNKEANVLIFEDNGKGIPQDLQKNLFKVGSTTKEGKEQQHGLGLSACMDYCVMMNATIHCSSKPGRTRFLIEFESTYEKLPSDSFVKISYKEKKEQLKKYRQYSQQLNRPEVGSGMYEAYVGDVLSVPEKDTSKRHDNPSLRTKKRRGVDGTHHEDV